MSILTIPHIKCAHPFSPQDGNRGKPEVSMIGTRREEVTYVLSPLV